MSVQSLMVANCPRCGKVFQKNLRNQCADCSRSIDSLLQGCLDYLRRNHRSTNEQLNAAIGITSEQMYAWIKEGKLLLTDYPNLNYPCASCTKLIRQHKLCQDCTFRINREIKELNDKQQTFQPVERKRQTALSGGFQIRDRLSGV
ncbi:flagellar protein [Paenibacillus aceris]|uniref:Ribosomal protein L32 n=1 Tax=Paenibacillus aceris TaxID=869555 RepID=A0ABS4HTV6_9BACL|nr:flagellar protein [Paenibacillus aceris]MBP1962039.1 ribosomal protein L32 [Paenibacillus aceris]NHW34113.1 flagellar protein [Paenibacillus aceris]